MADFTVRFDPTTEILHLSMTGFWTRETADAFSAEKRAATERIAGTPKRYDTLCDGRAFAIQSVEVSQVLGAIMTDQLEQSIGRSAVVVGSTLNKMQAERTLSDPRVGIFVTIAEAEAWLAAR